MANTSCTVSMLQQRTTRGNLAASRRLQTLNGAELKTGYVEKDPMPRAIESKTTKALTMAAIPFTRTWE